MANIKDIPRYLVTRELLWAEVERLRVVLKKAKPIVGAACAAASNQARPLREKVYAEICKVLTDG